METKHENIREWLKQLGWEDKDFTPDVIWYWQWAFRESKLKNELYNRVGAKPSESGSRFLW